MFLLLQRRHKGSEERDLYTEQKPLNPPGRSSFTGVLKVARALIRRFDELLEARYTLDSRPDWADMRS